MINWHPNFLWSNSVCNHTRDSKITRMITGKIGLHSVAMTILTAIRHHSFIDDFLFSKKSFLSRTLSQFHSFVQIYLQINYQQKQVLFSLPRETRQTSQHKYS